MLVPEDLQKRVELPAAHHVVTCEPLAQIVKPEIPDSGVLQDATEAPLHICHRNKLSAAVETGGHQFFVFYVGSMLRQFVKQNRVNR